MMPSGQRPTLSDYRSAVARLEQYSQEPRLKRCRPRLGADGQPGVDGGSFGAVYRVEDPQDDRVWALKCFVRDEPHREHRYRAIADCLRDARGSWRSEVHYLRNGLWVQGRWWPVVLMEWVSGQRLTDWIEALLEHRRPEARRELRRLAHRFASAVYQMHRSGISHGDLQSGNVLVTGETAVRFVDYDAMTVPGWSLPPRREDGHPDFRLPREGERGPDGATEVHHTAGVLGTGGTVFTSRASAGSPFQEPDALVAMHRDRFPSHVIHTALLMLSHDLSLWAALHRPGADHLLLSRRDFRDPAQSGNWQVLLRHRTDGVRERAQQLRALLDCPADLQPDLEPQPEVAAPEGVRNMAWLPVAGPRTEPRPFLGVGVFPASDERRGPAPAEEPRPAASAGPPSAGPAVPGAVVVPDPAPADAAPADASPTCSPTSAPRQPPELSPPPGRVVGPEPGPPIGPVPGPVAVPDPAPPVRPSPAPEPMPGRAEPPRAARPSVPEPRPASAPGAPAPATAPPPGTAPGPAAPASGRLAGPAPVTHEPGGHTADLFAALPPPEPGSPPDGPRPVRLVVQSLVAVVLLGVLLTLIVVLLVVVR